MRRGRRVCIMLPEAVFEDLQRLVEEKKFNNVSEAVRYAIFLLFREFMRGDPSEHIRKVLEFELDRVRRLEKEIVNRLRYWLTLRRFESIMSSSHVFIAYCANCKFVHKVSIARITSAEPIIKCCDRPNIVVAVLHNTFGHRYAKLLTDVADALFDILCKLKQYLDADVYEDLRHKIELVKKCLQHVA